MDHDGGWSRTEAEQEGKVGKFWICFEGAASGRLLDGLDVVGETESRSRVIPRILACTLGEIELPTEGVIDAGQPGDGLGTSGLGLKARSG